MKLRHTFLLSFILGLFLFPGTSYGCMGFGCNTDLAILGEVSSSDGDFVMIKPLHVFGNSQLPTEEEIKVENISHQMELGRKYALSLLKEEDHYRNFQGIFEIQGSTFEDARLLRITNGDEASLQWWINNNGKMPEPVYYGVDDKLFLRLGNSNSVFSQEIQVYPARLPRTHLVFLLLGSFGLGAASGYLFFKRKWKKPGTMSSKPSA